MSLPEVFAANGWPASFEYRDGDWVMTEWQGAGDQPTQAEIDAAVAAYAPPRELTPDGLAKALERRLQITEGELLNEARQRS